MWLSPDLRGLGLGAHLLRTLEAHAADHGIRTVKLETNRALTEAIALYHKAGYREVAAFNDEPHGDHWFEKELS
jgi:ribosomal protein S18 acetylase RimI-like enzyme